ncbi:unnamed protein product, partial [Ostreobium quekettii]
IMDTPRPDQVRAPHPEAAAASEEECMELLEMILGALGRDALGLGSSIDHPRESDEWKKMSLDEKYQFFAPIWRVMRAENMTAEEVKDQINHVALAVKQGSSASDMRSHSFSGKLLNSQVVYFRAAERGACDYVDDGRHNGRPHGVCWVDLCQDLEVVDVPGDHFSLLRQEPKDMSIIVNALKRKLIPLGWKEQVRRQRKEYKMTQEELQDLDRYLEDMGVKDDNLRHRLQGALPWVDEEDLAKASTASSSTLPAIIRLNNPSASGSALPPLFVVHDAAGGLGGMRGAFSHMERPCYGLLLQEATLKASLQTVPDLAALYLAAIRSRRARGPYVIGGVGMGCVIAYEVAAQLQARREVVEVALMFEDSQLREAWVVSRQPWFRLCKLIERERPDVDVAEYVSQGLMLAHEGPERQMEYILSLAPAHMERRQWDELIREASQDGGASGYGWEETLSAWVALYPLTASGGAKQPKLSEFIVTMHSLENLDRQLEHLSAAFKPPGDGQAAWDEAVNGIISRVSFFKHLTSRYKPGALFRGEPLFLHTDSSCTARDIAAGWAAASLKPIGMFLQPAVACRLEGRGPGAAKGVAGQIEFAIASAVRRLSTAREARSRSLALEQGRAFSPGGPPRRQDVTVLATALNEHCAESQYALSSPNAILSQRGGIGRTGGPLTSLPAWVVHDEKGDTGGFVKRMAEALPFPCYGLSMGPGAQACASIDDLASGYADLIVGMQPQGPYLIAGCSLVGCVLAFCVGCRLERRGTGAGLILLDGACTLPSIPLHEPMWYGLFYSLREMGTLKAGIGDFVERMRAASTPAEQLQKLRTYKPAQGVDDDRWRARHPSYNQL